MMALMALKSRSFERQASLLREAFQNAYPALIKKYFNTAGCRGLIKLEWGLLNRFGVFFAF